MNNREKLLVIYAHVAIWGSIGAMTRYYLSSILNNMDSIPIGTFTINSIGCLLLAMIYNFLGKMWQHNHRIVVGLGTGFVGAFTSFATFSIEVVKIAQSGDVATAMVYWFVGAVGGFFGAILGIKVTDLIFEKFGGEEL